MLFSAGQFFLPPKCQTSGRHWSCRALATYKLQTPFTALVQKPETRKMNEFFKETIFFFIFCFSFLLFVFKFRATGILCFPNNRKYKSDRMLNFSLMRSLFRAKHLAASWPQIAIFLPKTGLLIFRGKKSKISRDFQGQIRGKIGRFRGKKVKIRGTIGRFRAIFAGEKSKFAEKSAHFAGF